MSQPDLQEEAGVLLPSAPFAASRRRGALAGGATAVAAAVGALVLLAAGGGPLAGRPSEAHQLYDAASGAQGKFLSLHELTDIHKDDARAVFSAMDTDDDGMVSYNEFVSALEDKEALAGHAKTSKTKHKHSHGSPKRPAKESEGATMSSRYLHSKARSPVAPITPSSNSEELPWSEANTDDGHLSGSREAKLLGKTLRATVDVSQVGCGCVAGFFLYEGDQDPYCDASGSWPGKVERCGEIDLFEGNKFSWHSTLHNKMDHPGQQGGFGGMQQPDMMYGTGPRDMTGDQYGPGGSVIDTEMPFQVAISFPKASDGSLVDMIIMLYQDGKDEAVEWRVNKRREREGLDCARTDCEHCFSKPGCVYGREDMQTFANMLSSGMTVQSTWWGCDEPWLDGTVDGEEGGCKINPGEYGQENYGSYRDAHSECDGKWYSVKSWTLEDVQDAGQDWDKVLEAMDAAPVVRKTH